MLRNGTQVCFPGAGVGSPLTPVGRASSLLCHLHSGGHLPFFAVTAARRSGSLDPHARLHRAQLAVLPLGSWAAVPQGGRGGGLCAKPLFAFQISLWWTLKGE